MINIATLDALQDDELKSTQGLIDQILKKRDDSRKAKALEDARAIELRAENEARAVLAAAGLTLKDLNGNGKKKPAKGPVYHSGRGYQHPSDKTLVWNAKGQKPNWLRELESKGAAAVEAELSAVNDGITSPQRKNG